MPIKCSLKSGSGAPVPLLAARLTSASGFQSAVQTAPIPVPQSGGLTDTGSCPLPLGRRPSRGLSPPLGQRPGRVWFLPPTPLSGPPPLGPSLHQPPECLSHRPRRRLHDFCILELKLTFCSPNLGSCLSSFGFTFFPCERFWSNEVFIFFLVLNTLLCGHAEGD